jgi:hypothetical protein
MLALSLANSIPELYNDSIHTLDATNEPTIARWPRITFDQLSDFSRAWIVICRNYTSFVRRLWPIQIERKDERELPEKSQQHIVRCDRIVR